jgi:hypothetical protein
MGGHRIGVCPTAPCGVVDPHRLSDPRWALTREDLPSGSCARVGQYCCHPVMEPRAGIRSPRRWPSPRRTRPPAAPRGSLLARVSQNPAPSPRTARIGQQGLPLTPLSVRRKGSLNRPRTGRPTVNFTPTGPPPWRSAKWRCYARGGTKRGGNLSGRGEVPAFFVRYRSFGRITPSQTT